MQLPRLCFDDDWGFFLNDATPLGDENSLHLESGDAVTS